MANAFQVSDYFRILWTAVPDGIDSGRLRLRVLVQPRLFDTPAEADHGQVEDAVKACLHDWPSVVENLSKGIGSRLATRFYKLAPDGTWQLLTTAPLTVVLPPPVSGCKGQEWNPRSWRSKAWQQFVSGYYLGHTNPDPWICWPGSSSAGSAGRTVRATARPPGSPLRSPTFTRSYPAHEVSTSVRQVSRNQLGRLFTPPLSRGPNSFKDLDDDLSQLRWTSFDDPQAVDSAAADFEREKARVRAANGSDDSIPDKNFVDSYLQAIGSAQRGLASSVAIPSDETIRRGMYDHLGRISHRDLYRVAGRASAVNCRENIQQLSSGLYAQHGTLEATRTPQRAHFLSVATFHGRSAQPRSRPQPTLDQSDSSYVYDFFSKISLIQNYPNILPELGLVLMGYVEGMAAGELTGALGGAISGIGVIGAVAVVPVVQSSSALGLAVGSSDPVLSIASATSFNLGESSKDFRVADRHDLYQQSTSRMARGTPDDPTFRMVNWIKNGALDFTAQIHARTGIPSGPTAQSLMVTKLRMESLDYDGSALKLINFAQTQSRAIGPKIITSGVAPPNATGSSHFWILGANAKARKLLQWESPHPIPKSLDSVLADPTAAWDTLTRALTGQLDARLTTDWLAHQIVKNLDIALKIPDQHEASSVQTLKVSIRAHRKYNQTLRDPLDSQTLIWYLNSTENPPPDGFAQTPAHRSARISLISAARDSEVARSKFNTERLEGNWRANTRQSPTDPQPVILDSADLILGLAPYVLDAQAKTWVSMSRRRELYAWDQNHAHQCEFDTVAPVRLSTSRAADSPDSSNSDAPSQAADDDNAAPRLFRWSGPSLSVPPSSTDVTMHGSGNDQPSRPQPQTRIVPVTFSVPPNSEPRLRFSELDPTTGAPIALQFQVRIMNRAGGPSEGLPPTDKTSPADFAVGSCTHLRYEPIPAPVVLLSRQLDRTESPQKSPKRLVLDSFDVDSRWLAPPRADVDLCWTHGMFDVPDVESFDALGSFEAIRLGTNGNFRVKPVRKPGGQPTSPNDHPADAPIYKRGGPGVNREFPYYPDPMARRLAFRVEDFRGHVISTFLDHRASLNWYQKGRNWPHARAIQILLTSAGAHARAMRVEWDSDGEHLIVRLPRGWRATAKLMCVPDSERTSQFGLGVMGLYQDFITDPDSVRTLRDSLHASLEDPAMLLRKATLAGENPSVSPPLVLDLVHPVEKPLTEPICENLQLCQMGQPANGAFLLGAVQVDSKSTGLLDFTARWYDWSDDPNQSDRPMVAPAVADKTSTLGKALEQNLTISSKQWLVQEPNAGTTSVAINVSNGQHSFPDTRHRFVEYVARAHSSFRAYYESSRPATDFAATSTPTKLEFLSTTVPRAPSVAYGVPSFAWKAGSVPHQRRHYLSARRGGNVRLWINRGWFSTGEGELLGILCLQRDNPRNTITDQDAQGRFFSRWGSDPIRPHARLPSTYGPDATDFLGATTFAGVIARDDFDNPIPLALDLAAYSPQYDSVRRMWYCDVQFKAVPSSYAFIKLALVRYQPRSIAASSGAPWVGISRITLADFAQLYPNRATSVIRSASRRLEVGVYGLTNPFSDYNRDTDQDCGTFYIRVERRAHGETPSDEIAEHVSIVPKAPDSSAGELAHFTVEFPHGWLHRYTLSVFEGELVSNAQTIPPRIVYADVIELGHTGIL